VCNVSGVWSAGTTDRTARFLSDITRPGCRIGRHIGRPQLGDPARQRADGMGPADPLPDHRRRHRRKRLQQLSDPRLNSVDSRPRRRPLILRSDVAGQRRTNLFLETPSTLAICEIDICSARRNRRISAQSSTFNTRFLLTRCRARLSAEVINFQLPRPVQFSAAADTRCARPTQESLSSPPANSHHHRSRSR